MRPSDYARKRAEVSRKAGPIGELITRVRAYGDKMPPPPIVATPTKRKHAPKKDRESTVLRDCLKLLHKQGIFAYRQNTGTAWIDGQPVSFGYPGAGDITGVLPDGRRLEVECKSATGKQSAKQKAFQEKIETNNGVYILVRSVAELEEGLWGT